MFQLRKVQNCGKIAKIDYLVLGIGLPKSLKQATILIVSNGQFICLNSEHKDIFPSGLKYETISNIVYKSASYNPLVEILNLEFLDE